MLIHRHNSYPPPWLCTEAITILQLRIQNRAPIAATNWRLGRLKTKRNQTGWMMTEQQERLARERAEIAERVKNFRAMQKRFEQEREQYYKTTLSNAWDGFNRPVFWS